MLSACENVRKWRVCKPGMHGSPGRTGTLLEGQRGGVDGSDWNHRVLRGDHLCGVVVTEPARASEGSGRGPGAGTVSEGMEQEPWEKRKKKLKRQWA